MYYLKLLTIPCLFLFFSCQWEPTGVFENHIDQNTSPPDIEIVDLTLLMEKDTIELYFPSIYFHFESSNQKINQVRLYINDDLISTLKSNNGIFSFNPSNLYVGYHKLRIELFIASGTGSIADMVGAEGFLLSSKEWIVKVHGNSSYRAAVTMTDGYLKLHWLKYSFNDVAEYIIYRNNVEIGRTTAPEFVDPLYVGQIAEYRIKELLTNGHIRDFASVRAPKMMPKLKFIVGDNNNYSLEWDKPLFYSAIDSIILYGSFLNTYGSVLKKSIDPNDTYYHISDAVFGDTRTFWLMIKPKTYEPNVVVSTGPNQFYTTASIKGDIGYKSPVFKYFFPISRTEFIYHTNMYGSDNTAYKDSLFRYSVTENRIVERYRYVFNNPWSGDNLWYPTTSPNGEFIIANIGSTNSVFVGSCSNFTDNKVVDLSSFLAFRDFIPVSNLGTGLILSSAHKYLYDFIDERVLAQITTNVAFSYYDISPDGRYFFLNSSSMNLYSFIDNELTLIKNTSYSPLFNTYMKFDPNEPDTYIGWNSSTKLFVRISCIDFSVLNSFTVDEERILDIDFYDRRILSYAQNELVVRSLENGDVLNRVKTSFVSYNHYQKCHLLGNSIYYQKGLRYKID
jgi:hypothetical protein